MAVHRETCRRKELAGHHTCWLVLPGNHQQLHPVRHTHEEVRCYQQDTKQAVATCKSMESVSVQSNLGSFYT